MWICGKDGSWPSCLSLQGLPLCLSHPDINTRFVVGRVGGGEGVRSRPEAEDGCHGPVGKLCASGYYLESSWYNS